MKRGWPFYPEDYERDTNRLRGAIEHGAYFLLLKHYWKHGGLPSNNSLLCKIAGVSAQQWVSLRPLMQSFFHDGWKHKRVDRDLIKAAKFRSEQSQRSRKRWAKKPVDKNKFLLAEQLKEQNSTNALKNQQPKDPAGIPPASRQHPNTRIIDRLPFTAARTTAVEKWPPMCLPLGPATNNNGSSERQAQQKWEAALRTDLGLHYSTAIERLARDPDLVSRATLAEMEKEGEGVKVAKLGLTGKLIDPTEDLE